MAQTVDTTSRGAASGATETQLPIQSLVVLTALALIGGGALALGRDNPTQAGLFVIGAALGVALYHGAFGFTGAYRKALVERDVTGVRAQIAMLGLATILFAPVLAQGSAFGHGVVGSVAPLATMVAVGAFLFGIGMQLGGACASGTLFTVGGGSTRMVVTLAAFAAGTFIGSLHLGWWFQLPSLGSQSIAGLIGWELAVPVQLAVLGLIYIGVRAWGGKRAPSRRLWADLRPATLLRGPWPLLWSAIALALLNWATLLVAGNAWSITWGFTLWGAEAAQLFGWDPATSGFWQGGFQARALENGILADNTSLMNMAIILGALAAAGAAGRFRPGWRIPPRALLSAIVGGLLMGYGARLAFGCNIGALFSGIASTSLHGWLWLVAALIGNWVGIKARPLFGMSIR